MPALDPSPPSIASRGTAPVPGRAASWLTWGVIALAGCVLLGVALILHPIGDYFTESDFYGGYAEGARLVQRGVILPSRYGAVGPVYELALAVADWIARDLFTTARCLSVAAAVITLLCWRAIIQRRLGPHAALAGVALLAVNPTFFRYGYSATTDMLATGLQAAALWALLRGAGGRGPLFAGLLAALASLTRYSGLYLLPGGLIYLGFRRGAVDRVRTIGLFLVGFATLWLPWLMYSVAAGHWPGFALIRYFSYYARPDGTAAVLQDGSVPVTFPSYESLPSMLQHEFPRLAALVFGHLPTYLARHGAELLGWPVAALCVLGAAVALREGRGRGLLPVWLHGALLFAFSLPAFFSLRYALPMVPLWLSSAAAIMPSRQLVAREARPTSVLRFLLVGLVFVSSVWTSVATQREVLAQAPKEVLACSRVLSRSAGRARVMSRKGHLGYHAGVMTIAFPRFIGLDQLGDYARKNGATHLYYSWYDALTRRELAYLLDTSSAVPGLTVVWESDSAPAILYRIGPEIGRPPAWSSDSLLLRVHLSRGLVRFLPDSAAAPHHLFLGAHALVRGDPDEAVRHGALALAGRPGDALAWTLVGDAHARARRLDPALDAYQHAVRNDPGLLHPLVELGRTLRELGRTREAATAWRALIGRTRDPAVLGEMFDVFREAGDTPALEALRAWLQSQPDPAQP